VICGVLGEFEIGPLPERHCRREGSGTFWSKDAALRRRTGSALSVRCPCHFKALKGDTSKASEQHLSRLDCVFRRILV